MYLFLLGNVIKDVTPELTCELDPGTRRFLILSPVLGMWVPLVFPAPEVSPGTQPADGDVVSKTSAWYT